MNFDLSVIVQGTVSSDLHSGPVCPESAQVIYISIHTNPVKVNIQLDCSKLDGDNIFQKYHFIALLNIIFYLLLLHIE